MLHLLLLHRVPQGLEVLRLATPRDLKGPIPPAFLRMASILDPQAPTRVLQALLLKGLVLARALARASSRDFAKFLHKVLEDLLL